MKGYENTLDPTRLRNILKEAITTNEHTSRDELLNIIDNNLDKMARGGEDRMVIEFHIGSATGERAKYPYTKTLRLPPTNKIIAEEVIEELKARGFKLNELDTESYEIVLCNI